MTIDLLFDRYLDEYAPRTIDPARSRYASKHLLKTFAATDVETLSRPMLVAYRGSRQKDGAAPATINRELAVLASAIRWGNDQGIVKIRPRDIEIPRERENHRTEHITAEQVQELIDCAQEETTKAFIALLFATAQRFSAVLDLNKKQIIKGVIEFEKDGYAMASRRKRRARTPITPEIQSFLNLLEPDDDGYLFSEDGERITENQMRYRFNCAAEDAGLAHVTPHWLRHSAVSVAIEQGASLEQASKLAGHSSLGITEKVYFHSRPEFIAGPVGGLARAVRI